MKWKFIDTDLRACFTFSVDAPNPQLYCTHPLNIIICAFAFCNFRHLANPQTENSMQTFQSLSTPTYSTEKKQMQAPLKKAEHRRLRELCNKTKRLKQAHKKAYTALCK